MVEKKTDNKSEKLTKSDADKTSATDKKSDGNLKKQNAQPARPHVPTRSRFTRIVLETCSVALTLPIIWLTMLGICMNRDSIDLAFVKPHYEQWFSQAFDGKTTDIESYSARWLDDRRVFEVHAHNIQITASDGTQQTIADVRGAFRIKEGSWLRPQIVGLEIEGGALTLTRSRDKSLTIALGTPTSSQDIGALFSTDTPSVGDGLLGQIESVEVKQADVYLNDKVTGLQFAFADLSGIANLRPNFLQIDAVGRLVQGKTGDELEPSPFSVAASVDLHTQNIDLDLAVNNINLAKVFGGYPEKLIGETKSWSEEIVASFVKLDAPLDLTTTVKLGGGNTLNDIDAQTVATLQALQFNLIAGRGHLQTGKTFKPFSHARIEASYNGQKQHVEVSSLEIESEALNLDAHGTLDRHRTLDSKAKVLDQNWFENVDFSLNIPAGRLNPGVRFDGPISIKESHVSGYFNLTNRYAKFDKLVLNFGDFQTDLSGEVARGEDGAFNKIALNGQILGTINRSQILSFWPKDFVMGARNWIENSLQKGVVQNVKVMAALDEADLTSGQIANDHLNVKFDINDGDVRFMRTMPWLRDANGYGILQGNQADVFVLSGHVDGLAVQNGKVTIPKFKPHGGDFTIDLKGAGTIAEMLRVSNFPPFEFSKKFGLTPSEFGGAGIIDLHVTRPLLENFDQNRILYDLSGSFSDVSLPVGIGNRRFNGGTMSLKANKEGVFVTGPIKLGEWQTTMNWNKPLLVENTPAQYSVSGVITRDNLDNLGVGLRRHFGGTVALLIKGEGDSIAVSKADIFANFKDSDINIGTLWHKPRGEAGKLSGRIALDEKGGIRADNLALTAQGLDIAGAIALASNFQLQSIEMTQVKIADFIDTNLTAKPSAHGSLQMSMSGDFLNVEPWVKQAFKTQKSAITAPMDIEADIKTLRLDQNYLLTNAHATFSHTGEAIKHAVLRGDTQGGVFRAEIRGNGHAGIADKHLNKTGTIVPSANSAPSAPSAQPSALPRSVEVEIPDASRALLVFLGLGNIKGGQLKITGTLPPTGHNGGLVGDIDLQNFTLIRAPAFAQVLSLASLKGMADTLGGEGLAFKKLETQFSYENGKLKIRDGRASGPALGLTGEGNVDVVRKTLDMNGVLVPSYTVNSVLGDIPLLGDIIVGKKGEGMFALNYSIKGAFEKIQVSVNPLSALTPGFLRRIFDVKRDKIDDQDVIDLIKRQEQIKQ